MGRRIKNPTGPRPSIPAIRLDSISGITFYKSIAQFLTTYQFYELQYDPQNNMLYIYPSTENKAGAFKFCRVGFALRGTTTAWKNFGIEDGIYQVTWEHSNNRLKVDLSKKIHE